jgi:hypothetical protein
MVGIMRHILVLTLALAGAGPAPADEIPSPIPPINLDTVAALSGLDSQTLALAEVADQQHRELDEHVSQFLRKQRPRLFTYRALWAEMLERYENLKASAAENTFDPCEFVTDEALEKAKAAVQRAKETFEQHCCTASDEAKAIMSPDQYRLVLNSRANTDLPVPYRWLDLDKSSKDQIKRYIQVYQARLKLIERYPNLKGKLSYEELKTQIAGTLTRDQFAKLAELETTLKRVQATTQEAAGK